MNKVAASRVQYNQDSIWTSRVVALFSREQVDKSVLLLVACGDILDPGIKAETRQWFDIRARGLIAAKLSTVYENQLGKSNTPYGKAKLWAELAARWMVSTNDTVADMYRARKAILQLLQAEPPSAETVLKTFQTVYNHACIDVKKGTVPIDKLTPYVCPLPSGQDQVTVQALRFAIASAHSIKWSDFLVLTDEIKRQLDIIKRMPNVVIIFDKLELQLRDDWQQQWSAAESNQILAFYEMISKVHYMEEYNRYIEALVGVSYSLCKGPNIMSKWLANRLRKIQKKFPNFKIQNCISVEDIHTFISGYIKSEILVDDVYKFLKCVYCSLNGPIRKLVNLVIEQAVVHQYAHCIDFGAVNAKTKYRCLPYLIKNLPRVQWTKIAQIAVDIHRDPWHSILKAKTSVKELIDLANFGMVGMQVIREKFNTDIGGLICGGILSKEEIVDLVKGVSVENENVEGVVSLVGIGLPGSTLANVRFVFVEDRVFTHSSSHSDVTLEQDEDDLFLSEQDEINDALEQIGNHLEDQEDNIQELDSSSNNSIWSFLQEVQSDTLDEQTDVFGQNNKDEEGPEEGMLQLNSKNRKYWPKAARKLPESAIEITKAQLPELYARAIAIKKDIIAARVICKYLNIVGRRSVFHPFVKEDKKRAMSNRYKPIPAELREAAAVFRVRVPEDPVIDNLNDSPVNELTKAPRPVITEMPPKVEREPSVVETEDEEEDAQVKEKDADEQVEGQKDEQVEGKEVKQVDEPNKQEIDGLEDKQIVEKDVDEQIGKQDDEQVVEKEGQQDVLVNEEEVVDGQEDNRTKGQKDNKQVDEQEDKQVKGQDDIKQVVAQDGKQVKRQDDNNQVVAQDGKQVKGQNDNKQVVAKDVKPQVDGQDKQKGNQEDEQVVKKEHQQGVQVNEKVVDGQKDKHEVVQVVEKEEHREVKVNKKKEEQVNVKEDEKLMNQKLKKRRILSNKEMLLLL